MLIDYEFFVIDHSNPQVEFGFGIIIDDIKNKERSGGKTKVMCRFGNKLLVEEVKNLNITRFK